MELNFDYNGAPNGAIVFPDWCYGDQPKAPETIKETITLFGGPAQQVNIYGTADQGE